jgi:hypothetical protein
MKSITIAAASAAATFAALAMLTGAASAGTTAYIPPNSISTTQIKDGTIQLRDLSQETKFVLTRYQQRDTITTLTVKNGSLRLEDLDPRLQRLLLEVAAQNNIPIR